LNLLLSLRLLSAVFRLDLVKCFGKLG
jgi:hypothetical protein